MNRETWHKIRKMSWQEADKLLKEIYDPYIARASEYAYNNAWVSMMLALSDRYPELMRPEILHSIAVDTLQYSTGIDTPTELAEQLLSKTGFNILERPEDSELPYVAKEVS